MSNLHQSHLHQSHAIRRRKRPGLLIAAVGVLLWAIGCASSRDLPAYPAKMARPNPGNVVLVKNSILIVDASGSTDRTENFPQEKAVVQSFVEGMPPGRYQSAMRVLGGREEAQLHLETFDRYELRHRAQKLRWTGRETPLASLLEEYTTTLSGESGQSAFIIMTDGVPTRYGKFIGTKDTYEAAKRLARAHDGAICFHLVRIGNDPRGEALLNDIANLTPCGSVRGLSELNHTEALYTFQQSIYNGPPKPVAPRTTRRMTDLDGDGVDDRFDRCTKTPRGAVVDDRGCWVVEDYVFETNRARIVPEHIAPLEAVTAILKANPSLRIRLDGHTDDTGTSDYNVSLSQKRAGAVREFLEADGIESKRLEVRGFGSARPIDTNLTAEGR
ncbi:OmpA family protein, partial [Myxococcota bacterium]|nr:OmpA family protein [Myxococcota bacterium]